jgi:hypothetical protein
VRHGSEENTNRPICRRVGDSLATQLEERVIELRHLDDTIGGGDLYPLIRRELTDAQHVVNEASYNEQTGKRLLIALAALAATDTRRARTKDSLCFMT